MENKSTILKEVKELGELREQKKSKKGIVLAIVVLLILLFSLGVGVFFISQRTVFWVRAFAPGAGVGEVVLDNSYLFASPLSAQANGKEKIRVTVFLLDAQGKGVPGKVVFLGQNEKLKIDSVQAVSDNLGRAFFDVSSIAAADYLIEAKVDNQILPQRVKLNFR
ncbi:hypothetical protein MUP35_02140 [Patescibacteria group bacterium]|nr:hypothetical protein [Patescibacteria group bacterium]